MCCQQQIHFLLLVMVAVFLPLNEAVSHLVGGEQGWRQDVDYQAWADGQTFYVGDNLVFQYQKGDHNVIKVDEAGFNSCTAPPAAQVLESGSDVVELSTPGKKWYICGVAVHCSVADQKLEINVVSTNNMTSSYSQTMPSSSKGNREGAMVSLMMILSIISLV